MCSGAEWTPNGCRADHPVRGKTWKANEVPSEWGMHVQSLRPNVPDRINLSDSQERKPSFQNHILNLNDKRKGI